MTSGQENKNLSLVVYRSDWFMISDTSSLIVSESVEDYWALLKPRVMSLVVFTGLCGLLMAPAHIHPILGLTAILCIAVGAGASGCLNMWFDRDIDALMVRTQDRPLPRGRIAPDNALAFGVVLAIGSVLVMGVGVGWIAAFWLAVTIAFYVFVYTIWLKRTTSQNIVIGGAAGALPPVIGWAAVTGTTPLEAWILFAIIFLWTPPHFWALSLYRHEDYRRARIPMLPVTAGIPATKRQIVFYSILLVLASVAPAGVGMTSWAYGVCALALGGGFFFLSLRVLWSDDSKTAMQLFGYSIFYLFLLFLIMTVDRLWGTFL